MRRGLWVLGGVALLLLAATGMWLARRPAPVTPPLPDVIDDDEVRLVIERVRQGVLDKPRSGPAWGQLGMIYLAHLFDREAEFCFVQAEGLEPKEPRWPYSRGLIALKRDPENALPILRRAAELGGADYDLQLAEALLERGRTEEAKGLFAEVRRGEPANPRAAFGLGQVAQLEGDANEAKALFEQTRASPYARKASVARLAVLARAAGDVAAAERHERQAAAEPHDDPPWPDPLLDEVILLQVGRRGRDRRIDRLETAGKYREAADEYLAVIEREPGHAAAHVGAGVNLARLRRYDEAMPLLRQAVKLDPNSAQARYTLALALFARAEREKAEEPASPRPAGWFREVITQAREATKIKPDHGRAYMHWGLALRHLGEPAAALEPLRQGLARLPGDFELLLGLGEALLDVGRAKEAAPHLENAAKVRPDDPRLARALRRLRDGGA